MKILMSFFVLFLFFGCSDQSKKDTKQVQPVEKKVEVQQPAPKPVKKEVKKVAKKDVTKSEAIQKSVVKVKEKVKEIAKATSSVTSNPKVKEAVKKVTKALDSISGTNSKSDSSTNDAQKTAAGLLAGFGAPVTPSSNKSAIDASSLFKSKCSSCHGAKAQNHALGKSNIIAGWDSKKIQNALNGYRSGTYGGGMKAIMKGQAVQLNDEQISALANFISKL